MATGLVETNASDDLILLAPRVTLVFFVNDVVDHWNKLTDKEIFVPNINQFKQSVHAYLFASIYGNRTAAYDFMMWWWLFALQVS